MPTFEQARAGYAHLWSIMVVKPDRVLAADHIVTHILTRKADYQKVQDATGIPWFLVAGLHSRESDLNFNTHLHNGDPLSARTVHVPRGRPVSGEPPFTWYASAIDALQERALQNIKDWDIARILYEAEGYNGDGYELHNVNSPYVWAWSNLQQAGKYVEDGRWSADTWDTQCGVAVIINRLMIADQSVAHIVNAIPSLAPAPTPVQPAPAPTPVQPAPAPAPVIPTPVPPAPKKDPSMATTPVTVTLPTIESIPFAAIEQSLEKVVPLLPVISTFVPGLAPVVTIITDALPVLRAVASIATTFQADVAAGKTTTAAIADALVGLSTALKAIA